MSKSNFRVQLGLIFSTVLLLAHTCLSAAWTPPNADGTFPRTLFKNAELPALRAHCQTQPAHGLLTSLWSSVQSYSPGTGNFVTNGQRRVAAFNAKNAAFFLLLDRKPNATGLDTLSPTEQLFLRDRAIFLLAHQNTDVEAFPNLENYLWRSNEIINNAIAYDLLKGAQVPDSLLTTGRDLLQDMAGNLYGEVKFNFFNLGFFGLHADNHALRTCGALGLAGIVLSDAPNASGDEDPEKWFKLALYQIDHVLWRDNQRQSSPGVLGGYSEGPHYLRFGMKHVLPFFHSLHNFVADTTFTATFDGDDRQVRHPWHDPNYELLFEWVPRIKMPDGRSPALEDCFVATAWEEIAIMERPEWCPKVDYSRWAKVQPGTLWKMLHHSSDDVTADYLASRTYDAPDTFRHFQALPESGNLVYRSGWDSSSTYMHVTAKHGTARTAAQGHNQGDASSFILFAEGELLALDPGYLKWDRRTEVGEPAHHSLVLVDGQGPANGQIANPGGADAYIEAPFDLPSLDFAEVRTAYAGAQLRRTPLMVRKNYFILADQITSTSPHDYKWQLHGYGLENGDSLTGEFAFDPATGGTYSRGGAHLQAFTTAADIVPQISRGQNLHEWAYDTAQAHTTLYAEVAGQNDARFLTALLPYGTDTPSVGLLGADGALYVQHNGYTDIATVDGMAPATQIGMLNDMTSNADLAFVSLDSNKEMASLLMQNGTELVMGSVATAFASQPVTLGFEKLDAKNFRGYVSGPGTIELWTLSFWPQSVNGMTVQNWVYFPATGRLEITFNGGGYFWVHEDLVTGHSASEALEMRLAAYPVPVRDWMQVQTPGAGRLRLVDLMGREVWRGEVEAGEMVLEVNHLPEGWYGLVWENGTRREAIRILIQNPN